MEIADSPDRLRPDQRHIPVQDNHILISLRSLPRRLHRMARTLLLGLLHELHSQRGDRIPHQPSLVAHDHVNVFRRNNLTRRIHHVTYKRLPTNLVQYLRTPALEPRTFTRSHDHNGELHCLLSFKSLHLHPLT